MDVSLGEEANACQPQKGLRRYDRGATLVPLEPKFLSRAIGIVPLEQGMSRLGALATTIFYFLIVTSSVLLLAVVQIRAAGGQAYDNWRLNYGASLIKERDIQKQVNDAKPILAQAEGTLIFIEQCLSMFNEAGQWTGSISPDDKEAIKKETGNKNSNWFEMPGYLGCIYRSHNFLVYDRVIYRSNVDYMRANLASLMEKQKLNDAANGSLLTEHGDFIALNEMEKIPYWGGIIVIPYDLLILLLVVLMGALGGMVRLLRDYGVEGVPNPRPSAYFYVPLIGGVVAIGGYVFAKSGLLLLSSSRSEASLSPFTIGLVGITSGLLAREVIDTIAAKGIMLLRPDAVPRDKVSPAQADDPKSSVKPQPESVLAIEDQTTTAGGC